MRRGQPEIQQYHRDHRCDERNIRECVAASGK